MKKQILLFALLCGLAPLSLQAQTFTTNNNLLNPGSGNNQACAVDMNGDGLDDVVRAGSSGLTIDFQQPDGSFIQQTFPMVLQNTASWSIAAGDIDRNGYTDLVFGGGNNASFIYADDGGTGYSETLFTDYIFSQRSNFVDIDNDGNLDAFVCHDVDTSHPYRNNGSGVLTEDQSLIETIPVGGNYASVWVDFDHDGDIDMHMSKCRSGAPVGDAQRMNGLYRNNGDGTFSEVADEYGLEDGDQSWVTAFQDFDNDGDFDAYTVNHAWGNKLYSNDGTGHFTDVTAGSGINPNDLGSWSLVSADFDNDGFMDLLTESATNQEYYHNNGDFTFTPSSLNFNDGAICDLNNDGFLDVWTGGSLRLNDGNDNNWIKFHLTGIVSNINGIGTKVKIYGDWGVQIRESRSGESFSPMSSFNLHFGLGTATEVDSIEVFWPSGMVNVLENPQINSTVELIEAECLFEAGNIQASGPVSLCPGESVTLTAPEGYQYSWSQNMGTAQAINVTEPGNYSVIITDPNNDGCLSISNSISVSVVESVIPSIEYEGGQTLCSTEPIVLTASTEGSSYLWSTNENTPSISVNESGTYTVAVANQCDALLSLPLSLDFVTVEEPGISSILTVEQGNNLLEATGENINWYSDADLNNLLGTGNSIDYDVTNGQTIYLQSSEGLIGEIQSGGKEDFGAGGLPSTGGISYFDVYEPFTLLSVDVKALTPGQRTFELINENEEVIATEQANVSGEMTVALNWYIPVGVEYGIRCVTNDLHRSNSGVTYPYPIGDVGEIHSSTFGGQYYYYFYNWSIQKESTICYSDIVEVDLVISGIEELSEISSIDVYPNPTSDFINLAFELIEKVDLTLTLTNSLGQIIINNNLGSLANGNHLERIDISDLAAGTYELTMRSKDGFISESIIVK